MKIEVEIEDGLAKFLKELGLDVEEQVEKLEKIASYLWVILKDVVEE